MTPEQFRQIEDLFHRCKALPSDQQRALLDSECGDDAEVRSELLNLLAQADPEETLEDLRGKVDRVLRPGERDRSVAAAGPIIEGYDILHEIHRGAQGVVYQAVQKYTKRKVAIKVLLAGPYASKSARKRFEREIELVAQLKHPNIVSVFHSGQTSDHQQYCVMDYVRGVPLDQYARNQKLSLEEALKLFTKVCDAVNYAHQKGVIHRDLKSSNILVDAHGEPRVLDFGLAKQLAGREASLVSLTGQLFGTLPYMSPEQVEGNPEKIDIRTDVYSLGVTLYRLLTGEYAYPVDGNVGEVLQHIVQTEPRRPSLLRTDLNRDIDTIVLKALAKERGRRYPTAGALASDIVRFLAGQPIQARRENLIYVVTQKAMRWSARNERTALAMASLISVIVGLEFLTPLVFRWTSTNQWYEREVVARLMATESESAFDHVRMIAITDRTGFEALARQEQLEDVRADQLKSWRRVHGKLMRRLVHAKPRVVVWDVAFQGETPFDEDFAGGVKALREAGIPVVAGIRGWWFDESTLPRLSRTITPLVRWGCLNARFGRKEPWRVELAAQRAQRRPLPSLALAALAMWRHPDAEIDITIDQSRARATIQYTKPKSEFPQAWVMLADDDALSVQIQPEERDWPEFGLKSGDVVSSLVFTVPSDAILARSTIEYGSIFGAADDMLQGWFKDRVIVIGDRRSGVDRYPHPDGRDELSGCYGQASAIETGIENVLDGVHRPTKLPIATLRVSVLICSALFGLVIGLVTAGLHLRRYLVLLACAAVLALVSVLVAAGLHWIWNPIVPFLVLFSSCELCSAVHRVRLRRASWLIEEAVK